MTNTTDEWIDWPAFIDDNADGLDIPEFLRRPLAPVIAAPVVHAERRLLSPSECMLIIAERDDPTARDIKTRIAEKKEATRERIANLKAAAAAKENYSSLPRSKRRWDTIQNRFVGDEL